MPILEEELRNIKEDWNGHRIRLQKRTDRPNGVPNELYDFPELKGTCTSYIWKNCVAFSVSTADLF